jgi:hypothetical protein
LDDDEAGEGQLAEAETGAEPAPAAPTSPYHLTGFEPDDDITRTPE